MVSSPSRPDGPPSTGLPDVKTLITTHDPTTGKAIVHTSKPGSWQTLQGNHVGFNVVYTTSSFPANLNDNADITAHERLLSRGPPGLVVPRGTVCRIVDFGPDDDPDREPLMHRTQSLDYGVVLEGEVVMELDSGEQHVMGRGDVAVQRATMHAWRNRSRTEWARMLFVLQDCAPLVVGGERLKEDLGHGRGGDIPSSKNDDDD